MKYTGPIFRPPPEARTVLLQVTVGCAHNKCSFCTMYRSTKFKIEQMDQIEKDLKEAKATYGSLDRIFLVNGDAFVLSYAKLKPIAEKIHEYFPEMKTITMYASVRNIMGKTDEELKELRDLGVNDLWVGVETGNEEALGRLNKGFTLDDTYEQLRRLKDAGMDYNCILMFGTSGSGRGIENAIDTAKLVNETKPILLGVTSLGFFPGSELTREVEEGRFDPATELEILEEEKKLIELVDVDDVFFFGAHPINTININGRLPRDKEYLMNAIDHIIATTDKAFLNSVPQRSSL